MNRLFSILSILTFLALFVFALLMVTDIINPIINFKFLIVLFSLFLTFLSIGLFTFRQEVNQLFFFLITILLILPVFTLFMGLISADTFSRYWKLFVGGMIFQIGTGIYALVGGFVKKGISSSLKALAVFNYILLLFLAFILFLDITFLMQGIVFIVVGGVTSLLSLLIVLLRKPTISL